MIELGKKDPYIGKESKLQESVINWLRYSGYFCIHVPNGGSRNIVEATNLKKQGVLAGVSDILILDNVMEIQSRVLFKGIWIELKVKRGKLSEAQRSFIEQAEKCGYLVILAWNFQDLVGYFDKNIRRL